tara:strand:+ start:244 stop:549 length:306 start_codon:yes stop_codon:yes gene_type:complete
MKTIKTALYKTAQEVGLTLSAFVRDSLMAEVNMPIRDAQRIGDLVDQKVEESDWVETARGVTYRKSFDPRKEEDVVEENEYSPAYFGGEYPDVRRVLPPRE